MATVIATFVGTVISSMPNELRLAGNNGVRIAYGRFLWPGTTTTTCQPPTLGTVGSIVKYTLTASVSNTTAPYATVQADGSIIFTRQETATGSEYSMEVWYSG